ncbi:K(+)-insensitive pyrophosphate-energized proton pump (H(+)-PPase) like [Actinidia chinensis var. chinensis]|uniref:K(+)-insensitive pyrophosphate-energized proton pump (H(+)-PPase) like n=1 Tax=Actinidia chinensis var. chinensis TaxID=1590841 RepID=A0A2R6PV52_ACTCC|nr:K(+)-insensitive pyrophosphate-energized proton pump (H(+)-PPase) like [Actinidia chinensis var. chinensis]
MELEFPSIPLEVRPWKILRTSIHTFLQNYQYFTISALLALPFSLANLLSQTLVPFSPLLPKIHLHLQPLFHASNFPLSPKLFSILTLTLSRTLTSSILVLPFSLSFLLIAKTSIIQILSLQKPPLQPSFSSFLSIYNPILLTQICNLFLILSVNATCFSLLFLAFNFLEGLGYSSPASLLSLFATGFILYSLILANTIVTCNLALVSSGVEKYAGVFAILKACVLIRGRAATALAVAVPVNIALGGVEALFQYRVVRAYNEASSFEGFMGLEGFFVAYLYSIVVVIETIVSCELFKRCRSAFRVGNEEGRYFYWIEAGNVKNLEVLP